ncbi:MAG TPA: recombinase family protein [Candidatus Eisenbergiella intestinipullorum]|jgi:site-specific DNA recombinase|nr:recombinase family protein [Candidatus Eisenbergiella intestinipullorum]
MARKKRLDVNAVLEQECAGFGLQEEQSIYHTAGYIRLSVEDSGKTDGYSLENQEKLVKDFIAEQQDMRLYRLYIDNGATGTVFERPAFDEMMQDMKDGKINCIVVKDLSRLGRNYLEAGNYLEQIFPFFRVRFISITDGYDSNSPDVTDESLIIPLKNIINEGYAKDISQKITTSFEARKKQGQFMGKYPVYGYLKDPENKNHLIVNPETCGIVKRIFQMRDSGMALGAIASQLNEEGIPSPARYLWLKGLSKEERHKDSYWDRTNVKRLLTNKMYLGMLVYGKERTSFAKGIKRQRVPESEWKYVPNAHEAIIDQELFDSVQRKLEGAKQNFLNMTGINEDYQPENLFRGRIHCSDCGRAMKMTKFVTTRKDGSTDRYAVYECCRRKQLYDLSCPQRSIHKSIIDKTVEEAIRFHIRTFLDTEQVIAKLNRSPKGRAAASNIQNHIREKQRRITKIERLSTGIYEDYREGILDEEEYLAIRRQYGAEKEELLKEVDALMLAETEHEADYHSTGSLADIVRKYAEFQELSREIVEAFITDIQVHTDSHLAITFAFEDEFQRLIDMAEQRRRETV